MRKMQFKRIGLTVLILALLTMLIVGTSVVSAIAKNTTDRSGASDAVSSREKENTILLNSYMSNAVNNRSKWLYDLMIASGLAQPGNSSNGAAIFQKAYEVGLIGAYTEDDIYLPLNRLFVAQTTVKALHYPERTVGELSDVSADQKSVMGTMAYYGYFVPDDKDMVYPEATISAKEYEMLRTELNRYKMLKGKRILAFGDSIMHGSGNNDEGIADMIAAKYAMTALDYSVPGASFADRSERSRISNQIRVAYNDQAQADIILLNGGTNDMGHMPFGETAAGFDMSEVEENSFSGGMQKALWMLKACWKDTPIIYTRVHNMDLFEDRIERQYGDRALDIMEKWGIPSVDLYNGTTMNTENKAICDRYTFVDERYGNEHDSIHPNALGYAKFYLPPISKAVADQFSEVSK